MNLPEYVQEIDGVLYCFLDGELDKSIFENQCAKCPLKNKCTTKKDIYKDVSGDWHSLNASGLYGDEFDKCTDKFKRKDLRGIAKIVGLALCYGGTAYTVAGNMKTTKEDAQKKIDNFFRLLNTLNIYMLLTKKRVLEIGKIYNLFGRCRSVEKWAFSASWKEKAYAQRSALNHPIQSSSAEILKIMMIRVDEYIERNGLSPLYGLGIQQHIDLDVVSYSDMVLHELMSTHDEIDYLFNEEHMDQLLPIIYEIMQLKDVMEAFNIGFGLDLDCEYSKEDRSLIASNRYLNSKIYTVNKLKKNKMIGGSNIEPNAISIDFKDIDPNFVDQISKITSQNKDDMYDLVICSEEGVYFHKDKFSLSIIEQLGIKHRLVCVN